MTEIELPIFPLPIVLFPGTPQPLHIFEPRYRQLVADCLEGHTPFGLSLVHQGDDGSDTPHPGNIGCSSRIRSHHTLPDGRSNILVIGENRYVFKRLLDRDKQYFVGSVQFFHDDPSPDPELPRVTAKVRAFFGEYIRSAGVLPEETAQVAIPDDPELLSYHVAAALDIDLAAKEALFRLNSTRIRLERLRDLLKPLIDHAAHGTSARQLARRNGKGARTRTLPVE